MTPVPGTADEATVPLGGTEAPGPTGQAPPPAEPPAGGMETTTPEPAVATGGPSVLPTSESTTPTTAAPQGGTAASAEPPAATNPAATDNVAAPANPAPLGAIVYAVHLESVKAEEGATREAARLAQQGLPTFVHRTEIPDKGTWWRVYVGPYGTRDEAAVVATDLLASGRDYAQVHKLKKDEVGR